jgi:adenylate cyclase
VAEEVTSDDVRAILSGEHPGLAAQRRNFARIPSNPRCRLCAAPFGGVGRLVFKQMGYGRSSGNPALCEKCIVALRRVGLSGVEIPVTLLFSDVRGSTAMGQRMRPTEFHDFLHHFYGLASDAIVRHNGLVDKIVGDEVIGLFFGGVSGPNHPGAAVAAALDLARAAAHHNATPAGPIPAGTAVHTGEAFVGSTGLPGTAEDFTALGDAVNTTARLASAARAGEVLVSVAAAEASGTAIDHLERRMLDIRGRSDPVEVVVLRPAEPELTAGA